MLSLIIVGCFGARALAQANSRELPIPIPTGATVTFEIDARDDDLLAFVKQVLSPSAGGIPSITVSIPGDKAQIFNYAVQNGLGDVLRSLHRVHVLGFTPLDDQKDIIAYYEGPMRKQGGKRMVYFGGDSPFLAMRFDKPAGMEIVAKISDTVYVLRTDGMIDLAALGRMFSSIAPAKPTK